jgi:hypothetical protein
MGETTARRGTEKRQRSRLVAVRCTDAELATIATAAARAGMTVGAFMRHQAIGTPGPRALRRPQVDRAELSRVLAALGRFGSNVNQLAHAANCGEIPARHELTEAATATLDMRAMLMRALGRPVE